MALRLLADENIPGPLVSALRADGHDVAWVVESGPGTPDPDVLAAAQRENRILITNDRDFGQLAFQLRQTASAGVIQLRLPAPSLRSFVEISVSALRVPREWQGCFSVVEVGRVRMVQLPRREG
jgi:predicted nuclease of predicted toxin-antitoxin system